MASDEITVAPSSTSSPISPSSQHGSLSNMAESSIDSPPVKAVAQPRNGRFHALDFISPARKDDELTTDLTDFGFEKNQIKEMMGKHEFKFDSTMQRPWMQTFEDRRRERQEATDAKKPRKGRGMKKGEKYQSLYLTEGTNWVLFDPSEGFPPQLGEPPTIFKEFAKYRPGNTKVLETNLIVSSVRLRTTPEILRGMTVDYTDSGPRLREAKPQEPQEPPKRARGRPRKYPVAVTGTTVGAGAVVKRKKKVKSAVKVEESSSEMGLDDVSDESLMDLEMDEDEAEVAESPE